MYNKINNMNPFKIGILSFFFILSTLSYSMTYYVDSTGGNDSNDGITPGAAWKSLSKVASVTYNPGDSILFKRGGIFSATTKFEFKSSGTATNNIVIDAYGTGKKPIITPLKEQVLSWSNIGSNIWKATGITSNPMRLLRDGIELLGAVDSAEMDGIKYHWYWDSGNLYIKMSDNPTNHKIEFSTISSALLLAKKKYITISNLDFQGGTSYCVYLYGSDYITVNSCNIGKYACKGIQLSGVSGSHHCVIENSNVDSYYSFTYTGSPHRGAREGILMQAPSTYNYIRNNIIKNWGHANINLYNASNNKIYGNYSTAADISSGGRISLDGVTCHSNEVFNNTFKDYHAQNQINGHNNHVHHNIFDGMKDTSAGVSYFGRGLDIHAYDTAVYGNIIEDNVFMNTEREAIYVSSNNKGHTLDNITIRNNTIYETGKHRYNRAITIETGGSGPDPTNIHISGNNIYNSSTENTISYYGVTLTAETLNSKTLANANTADNVLDLTSVGSAVKPDIEPGEGIEPGEESPSGPFTMSQKGLLR